MKLLVPVALAMASQVSAATTILRLEGVATVHTNSYPVDGPYASFYADQIVGQPKEGQKFNFYIDLTIVGDISSKNWNVSYIEIPSSTEFGDIFTQSYRYGNLSSISADFWIEWYDNDNARGLDYSSLHFNDGKIYLNSSYSFEGSEGCRYGEDEDHPCYGNYEYDFNASGRFENAYVNGERVGSLSSIIDTAPEPASWALMIAGFGLVGGAVRRRRLAESRIGS